MSLTYGKCGEPCLMSRDTSINGEYAWRYTGLGWIWANSVGPCSSASADGVVTDMTVG